MAVARPPFRPGDGRVKGQRGLPLFELFNPIRRSSSAIWALSAATSAMSSSRDSSAADSAFIESLNQDSHHQKREPYRRPLPERVVDPFETSGQGKGDAPGRVEYRNDASGNAVADGAGAGAPAGSLDALSADTER
jgi:hypothetical protein